MKLVPSLIHSQPDSRRQRSSAGGIQKQMTEHEFFSAQRIIISYFLNKLHKTNILRVNNYIAVANMANWCLHTVYRKKISVCGEVHLFIKTN